MPEQTALLLAGVAASEQVPRPVWEVLLMLLGGIAAGLAIAAFAWKVARPHVEGYVRSVVAPLQDTADRVHHQVAVNGGRNNPATLLDEVGNVKTEVAGLRTDFNAHLAAATRDSEQMWSAIEAVANSSPPRK